MPDLRDGCWRHAAPLRVSGRRSGHGFCTASVPRCTAVCGPIVIRYYGSP